MDKKHHEHEHQHEKPEHETARKGKPAGVNFYLIIALIIILLQAGFIGYLLATKGPVAVDNSMTGNTNGNAPPPEPEIPEPVGPALRQTGDVQFATSDNVIIKGTLTFPSEYKEAYPVVILVHQLNGNRRQWDSFVPTLLGNGYAVLAYDIRGMGESTKMYSGTAEVDYIKPSVDWTYKDSMINDMRAALDFVLNRPDIDGSRIAAMGASIGGSVVYVSSGVYPQIKTSIVLSPANDADGPLSGFFITNFNPHGIMFMSDTFEGPNTGALYGIADEPKRRELYPGPSHGVGLLTKQAVVDDVLEWLRTTL
ncbi:MAG: alpha/beta fold hydrolase [Candidatus Aenigmarchaeota archaeon]|nr:alpha/beta fold hydrolase [Candidatus Aenigmarchaeota archaeon]